MVGAPRWPGGWLGLVALFARAASTWAAEGQTSWCSANSSCCAVLMEVTLLNAKYSGTKDGVKVAFRIDGHWTRDAVLAERVDDPTDGRARVRQQFAMSGWPAALRISAAGDDAFGFQRIELSLPSGELVPVVVAPIAASKEADGPKYPESKESPGYVYWVDENEVASTSQTFDVPQDVDKTCFEAGSPIFDCEGDAASWSAKEKDWCCKNKHSGCSHTGNHSGKHDCSAGDADPDAVRKWGKDKKFWCCGWETDGCSHGKRYDCKVDLANWLSRWSQDKVRWCCEHENQGCSGSHGGSSDAEFNCREDVAKWDERWAEDKKEWCCAREATGCSGPGRFDCSLARSDQHSWSADKRSWCSHDELSDRRAASGCCALGGSERPTRAPPVATEMAEKKPAGLTMLQGGVLLAALGALLCCSCGAVLYLASSKPSGYGTPPAQ